MIILSSTPVRREPLGTSVGTKVPARSRGICRLISPSDRGHGLRVGPVAGVREEPAVTFALLVAQVVAQLGFQAVFQPGTDDLLNEPVFAVKLDFFAVD